MLVGLVVASAGCSSGEAEPSALPPVPSAEASASTGASASSAPLDSGDGEGTTGPAPVSSPLTIPAEAAAATPVGAGVFVRHYMTVLQAALASSDASQLQQLSDVGCGGCQNLIRAVEEARASGQRVRGADFLVQFVEAPPVEGGEVTVDLRYARAAGVLLDDGGSVVTPIAAEGPIDAQMRLRHQADSWLVLGFRQISA